MAVGDHPVIVVSFRHERERLFIFQKIFNIYLLFILRLEWPQVLPLVVVDIVHLLVGLG